MTSSEPTIEPHARVFFALWPNAAMASSIQAVAKDWKAICDGRIMRSDTLHVTLAFVGDVLNTRLPALKKIGDGLSGRVFSLVLDRGGYWVHNRIAWLGSSQSPEMLAQLVEQLNGQLDAAGFRVERRRYTPHVTLLRNVRCEARLPAPPRLEWPVHDLVLVRSQLDGRGAHYQVVGRWPLAENVE